MKSNDARLWDSIKTGNKSALGELFCLLNHRMFNYGYKIVEDPDQVKDAIQDVFVTNWRRHDQLLEVKSSPAYLFIALKMRLYRILQNEPKKTGGEAYRKRKMRIQFLCFMRMRYTFLLNLTLKNKRC